MEQKSTNTVTVKQLRKKYSPQFKEQAVELAKKRWSAKSRKRFGNT